MLVFTFLHDEQAAGLYRREFRNRNTQINVYQMHQKDESVFAFKKKKYIDRFILSSKGIRRSQLWAHIACLTPGCGLFAGDILGHSWHDGGLLHIHQQEGL